MPDEANDRRVSSPAWNYKTELTQAQYENIAVATDASNSDMDWSDDGKGGVYITYQLVQPSLVCEHVPRSGGGPERHTEGVAKELLRGVKELIVCVDVC